MDLHPIFDEENTALTRTNTFEPRVIYVAVRAMVVRWSCDGRTIVEWRSYDRHMERDAFFNAFYGWNR